MSEKPTYEELEMQVRELTRTGARQAEALAALQKREEKYRLIAEQNADAIYTLNIEREQFTFVNPSMERVFGYPLEECLKLRGRDLLTEASYMLQREAMLKAYKVGRREPAVLELEAIRKDGRMLPIEVSARFLFDAHGKPVEVLGVARDITERKKVEEERSDLQRQLFQAQKVESIGRLAGGVAHDYNNMLGVIIGRAEMGLDRAKKDPSLTSDLKTILKVARHSAALTRQLLAFARMQNGSPKVIDLNETLKDMLGMLQHLIGEGIALDWRVRDGLWPTKIDSSHINQVLVNLCVNARDAIQNVGRITIETRNVHLDKTACGDCGGAVPGDYVMIRFSDTGCGIDPTIRDFIFEPFFTTKGMGKGTGLGLSTVHGIIKQNKGFIDVSSEKGRGTTFRIYLPRHRGKADRAPVEDWKPSALHGNEAILLVEDEPTMLEMTTLMLKKMGHTVFATSEPSDAIRLIEENPKEIQLLITDVVMPGMNGKELADELLSREPALKCLFMSGYAADTLLHHARFDGENHFIQKPFTVNDLMPKVRAMLDSSAG
jgi:two-component system sensor histidine kinase EvgS